MEVINVINYEAVMELMRKIYRCKTKPAELLFVAWKRKVEINNNVQLLIEGNDVILANARSRY